MVKAWKINKNRKVRDSTVESCVNVPPSKVNPPLAEAIPKSLEQFFFIFYINNNRNPPITEKNNWFVEIR